jgi:hypothetical protein
MKKSLLLVLLIPSLSNLYSQSAAILPLPFQQFFRNYAILNPASSGRESKIELYLADKVNDGAFSGVNVYGANLNYTLGKEKDQLRTKNVVGGLFTNEKVGPYIGRSRAYFSYAVHLPLNHHLKFSGGAALGFADYYYQASQVYPGSSSWAPTGNIGLWLYDEQKFNLGISINQLYSGKLRPFVETFKLTPNLNINADKYFQLNPYVQLMSGVWIQYVNKSNYDINLVALSTLHKSFSGGIAYRYKKGFTFYIGIEKVPIGNYTMKWMTSYYIRTGNSSNTYNISSFEISLFVIKRKEVKEDTEYSFYLKQE